MAKFWTTWRLSVILVIGWALVHTLFISPPRDFEAGKVVTVAEGSSLTEIAAHFAEAKVVRSPTIFKYLIYFAKPKGVAVAGDYVFPKPANAVAVANRLARGQYGIEPVEVTIPEGATSYEIAELIAKVIPTFNQEGFTDLATPREGYLFPDTYTFQPTWSAARIVGMMEDQFEAKFKTLESLLETSGRTSEQVVIMASLLEREARTTESRQMIAGILWKRLDEGMPLQVDAVFPYIIGKNTFEVTRKDLATSSPYNTYRFRGLPAGPIANPGLDSLTAALTPIESDYWFYLSDASGRFHYATDFDGHKLNRIRYLP